ncbi:putative GH25 family protein [Sphingomonas sp. UYAg733]
MIARIFALGVLCLATAADAHDFWLQPARWRAGPGEPIGLTLQVGHGAYRQRSPVPSSRVIRFEAIAPDGRRIDLRNGLHIGGSSEDAAIAFGKPGTYSIVLETDNRAESHLPAIRFNDYLRVEGLTPAIALRARAGKSDADGAENYSRHARTIVQIGPLDPRGQGQIVRPAGLALEIVPEVSPLAAARGGALPVRIYYRGRPLAGALVKLNDLAHDAQPIEMHRSDAQGRTVFAMPGKGSWQLNVIWTRPQPRSSLTDFDTSFSSLSFGLVN